MKANFAEAVAAVGGDSNTLKFQEGDNNVRVLTNTIAREFQYEDGRKGTKFLCYVWEYASKGIKLAFFNKTIARKLAELQLDKNGYGFDNMPMPYDLNIKVKNPGTIDAEYEVLPARSNSDVPSEALEALKSEPTIEEVVAKMEAEKNAATSSGLPT